MMHVNTTGSPPRYVDGRPFAPGLPLRHNWRNERTSIPGGREWKSISTRSPPNGNSAPISIRASTRTGTAARSPTPTAFGPSTASAFDWIKPFHKVKNTSFGTGQRLDQMVRGRHHSTSPTIASTGISRSAPIRRRSSGRATIPRNREQDHLSRTARRGLPLRQCSAQPQCQEGRHRHDLHADDPGSGLCDSRLRPHRRGAFGRVRRLLAGFAGQPHRRLPVARRHHRRRGPTRRPRCRSKPMPTRRLRKRRRRAGDRRQAHRRRGRHGSRARRLLSRRRKRRDARMSVRGDACGRPAVHPLHVRLDRRAERRRCTRPAAISSTPR